jgi:hypothetical protein
VRDQERPEARTICRAFDGQAQHAAEPAMQAYGHLVVGLAWPLPGVFVAWDAEPAQQGGLLAACSGQDSPPHGYAVPRTRVTICFSRSFVPSDLEPAPPAPIPVGYRRRQMIVVAHERMGPLT